MRREWPPALPAMLATAIAVPASRGAGTAAATDSSSRPVLATANIFGAGYGDAPEPGGGGGGTLPPGWRLPAGSARVVTFPSITGTVSPKGDSAPYNGPQGDVIGHTDIDSWRGISGIVDGKNGMFLVGVFLADREPGLPAPLRLDFTNRERFDTLAPLIGQTVFIGDGSGRRYEVPEGATRLYVGFADAYNGVFYQGQPGYYGNNAGRLSVVASGVLGDSEHALDTTAPELHGVRNMKGHRATREEARTGSLFRLRGGRSRRHAAGRLHAAIGQLLQRGADARQLLRHRLERQHEQGVVHGHGQATSEVTTKGKISMNLFRTRTGAAGMAAAVAVLIVLTAPALAGWGPATPNFNLEAQLRPVAGGPDNSFGLVKFRQPKDAVTIVYLDVWVRDLAPNHSYLVQRATDLSVDDQCTGVNWPTPTLGQITTDETGTGRAPLSRGLPASLLGTEFDIRFRLVDAVTSAVVLQSACYQFVVSQ